VGLNHGLLWDAVPLPFGSPVPILGFTDVQALDRLSLFQGIMDPANLYPRHISQLALFAGQIRGEHFQFDIGVQQLWQRHDTEVGRDLVDLGSNGLKRHGSTSPTSVNRALVARHPADS
jgi:hypothetical protein